MTLIETISSLNNYGSNWAIYAKKNQAGKFTKDSPCRYGQTIFENGGLLDDCEYFDNNSSIMDTISEYYGSFEPDQFNPEEFNRWILLFEEDVAGTPPNPVDWGGNKRDVIDYIMDNHQKLYDDLYDRWVDFNQKEFFVEAVENLIETVNEVSN